LTVIHEERASWACREWLQVLETASREVLQTMVHTEEVPLGAKASEAAEFTAMIGLAGQIRGVLTVRCGRETATLIAALMLDLDPEQAAGHAWDALGEVANMIAGNFKNKLHGGSDACMLSIPTVITGGDYMLRSPADTLPLDLWFSFRGQPLSVMLEVQR
jgi:chemotaxis protein CheX